MRLIEVHTDDYRNWVFDPSHPTQGRRFINAHERLQTLAAEQGVDVTAVESDYLPDMQVMRLDPELWDEQIAEDWIADDEFADAYFEDLSLIPRWVSVNGLRLVCLSVEGGPTRLAEPVLVDFSEQEFVPRRELVTHGWFSESGGAPISWDGGNSLSELSQHFLLMRQWGDYGNEARCVLIPSTTSALVELIARWAMGVQADVAWALATTQLDPQASLSADDRELWEARVDAPELSLSLDLSVELREAVTKQLRGTDRFARIAEGLTDPHGEEGQRLAEAFDDVMESGVLGAILNF